MKRDVYAEVVREARAEAQAEIGGVLDDALATADENGLDEFTIEYIVRKFAAYFVGADDDDT